jgi:hypothetical protein
MCGTDSIVLLIFLNPKSTPEKLGDLHFGGGLRRGRRGVRCRVGLSTDSTLRVKDLGEIVLQGFDLLVQASDVALVVKCGVGVINVLDQPIGVLHSQGGEL